MRSAAVYVAALASVAYAVPQSNNFGINVDQAVTVASEIVSFVSSVTANPAFTSDIAALETAIPSSVIAAAESDPEAFAVALFTATSVPSWISAFPTDALNSLETILAKPVKAGEDLDNYLASVVQQPGFPSVLQVLATAIPSSVQAQAAADPEAFIKAQITDTAIPDYLTALPSDVQSDIGSVINQGLSIIASDFAASSVSVSLPAKFANATGSSTSSSKPATFTGSASTFKTTAVGAGVISALCVVLALL